MMHAQPAHLIAWLAALAVVVPVTGRSEWSLKDILPGHSKKANSSVDAKPPRACGVLWYYHIPKTAGESVNSWLFQMKDQRQFDDVYVLHNMSREVDVDAFLQDKLEPIIEAPEGKLVVVHHHDRAKGLYNMSGTFTGIKRRLEAKGCNLYRMTFLREPMALLKASLIFYDSAEHNPGYEWVAPDPVKGLEDVKERFQKALDTDPIYDNMMVRYILNNLGEGGPQPRVQNAGHPMGIGEVNNEAMLMARDVLREFQFVGFADDTLDAYVAFVAKKLGLENLSGGLPKLNVYGVNQVNMRANTDAEQLENAGLNEVLAERCKLDAQLYDIISEERGLGSSKTVIQDKEAVQTSSK